MLSAHCERFCTYLGQGGYVIEVLERVQVIVERTQQIRLSTQRNRNQGMEL